MKIRQITAADDLTRITDQINRCAWDEDNEISEYDANSLASYLERQDTVFVVCWEDEAEQVLLGMASSRIEIKPYAGERWLYVDEVDVSAAHRRKGAGKQIMQFLIDFAEDNNCEEVWLGTEADNEPAKALYRSLDPDDVADVVGFTWETD